MRHIFFRRSLFLALALFAWGAIDAQAAFIYSLRFDQTLYTVHPGTLTVNLIFREEVTGSDVNQITDTNGLSTANVRVNFGATGPATYATNSATKGAQFTAATFDQQANFVVINQNVLLGGGNFGATGTQVSPTVREVDVGSLTFNIGTVPPSIATTISFSDPSGGNDIVIGSSGFIDESQINYGSALIKNPEPSTFLLTGMGVLGGMAIARFRRRRSAPAPA